MKPGYIEKDNETSIKYKGGGYLYLDQLTENKANHFKYWYSCCNINKALAGFNVKGRR